MRSRVFPLVIISLFTPTCFVILQTPHSTQAAFASASQQLQDRARKEVPEACPVTKPPAQPFVPPPPYWTDHGPDAFWIGTRKLWTMLPNNGIWHVLPIDSNGRIAHAARDIAAYSLWLANCYFAHNSLRFPALLPFFNASSPRPFHPPNRRPDPVVPTWRRPFPRCQFLLLKHQLLILNRSLTPISHSVLVGPYPCRLDDALGPSYSSSPFRNRTEALTLLALHKAMCKRKYRMLFSSNRRRKPGPKGPRTHPFGSRNEAP